ncbi:hypothetical protein ACKTEK_03240 [Tepidamorphus sp. 3E244]|uniref:hypothetical protein n=1 Tax=Tepidamorphus sp. 3E244 TaxID=3385498 RepID=UPI0038FC93AE
MAELAGQKGIKLSAYLETLPAGALVRLVHELDRVTIVDDLDASNSLILESARQALRSSGRFGKLAAQPERAAFADAEPFRIHVVTDRKHRGRISAEALRKIWQVLARGEGGDEIAAAACEHAVQLTCFDRPSRTPLQDQRDVVYKALLDLRKLAASMPGELGRNRSRINAPHALEELADLTAIVSMGGRLETFRAASRFAISEATLADDALRARLVQALAPFSDEELVYPVVMTLGRLPNPGSLVHLLTATEGSDDPGKLMRSRYACVANALLNELDILVELVAARLGEWKVTDGVIPAVRRFHEISTSLTVAIDLDGQSDWATRLAAKRRRIADTLRDTLERTLAVLRLGIQPNVPGLGMPDAIDTEHAIASAELLMAIRPLRSELALNECVTRVHAAVENFFDTAARALPQQARQASPADRAVLDVRFDALYRTSVPLFGEEYAALLRRSCEVAGLRLPEREDSCAA